MKKSLSLWRACAALVCIAGVINYVLGQIYSSVVPQLAGMPFTFWFSIMITTILVGLTYYASRIFPFKED